MPGAFAWRGRRLQACDLTPQKQGTAVYSAETAGYIQALLWFFDVVKTELQTGGGPVGPAHEWLLDARPDIGRAPGHDRMVW